MPGLAAGCTLITALAGVNAILLLILVDHYTCRCKVILHRRSVRREEWDEGVGKIPAGEPGHHGPRHLLR